MLQKFLDLIRRSREIEKSLQDPAVTGNPAKRALLMKEYGQLQRHRELYREFQEVRSRIEEVQKILSATADGELRILAGEELETARKREGELLQKMEELLVDEPSDADRRFILEIRPGVGGEESALFAADLYRMYMRICERHGWKTECIELSTSDLGGVRTAIFSVSGPGAWKALRWEAGTHRVQRVPRTEASGRIHTSTVTVAVLPEVEDAEFELKPEDLKVETACAGGPGGQHVNKTESAVRMVHLPTGIEVVSRTQRSQHQNRALALQLMKARLAEHYRALQKREERNLRKVQIGTGERSEKIRTYNFPQNRVTDHRVNFTSHRLAEILDGDADELFEALQEEERRKKIEILRT